jgi:hypothetical protein
MVQVVAVRYCRVPVVRLIRRFLPAQLAGGVEQATSAVRNLTVRVGIGVPIPVPISISVTIATRVAVSVGIAVAVNICVSITIYVGISIATAALAGAKGSIRLAYLGSRAAIGAGAR